MIRITNLAYGTIMYLIGIITGTAIMYGLMN